jgi:GntR family transcriptional regulator
MLNPNSPIPLYHQLADIIATKIQSGEYIEENAIPSEIELKNQYKIGRPTVRQALEQLVKKDLIFKKRGAGTFVKKSRREVDLFSLAGTSLAFGAKDISIETIILENISLVNVEKDKENPFFNTVAGAFYMSRLTRAENKPVLIEDIYFHPILFAGIDKIDLKGKSLARLVLDHYYLKPENGRQIFKIASLSPKNAELLNLDQNDKILEVKRTLNFPGAKRALYSKLLCKTDDFAFAQSISSNGKY